MSVCPILIGDATGGIAAALRSIDCYTGEATATAFGRLFGINGRLMPVLTLLLTLYVAFYAIRLLTGRARLGGGLTPRMMTLGLVLTFATSWLAYQNVVWQLAVGGPDQVASLIAGTHGSATSAFADQLDRLFAAVADIADQASKPAAPTETGITPATAMVGGFTASTVLWLSALMLLLGTVGVLVTAKIVLAVLLAVGPLFIVFALFGGTRGLFEGWLRATTLFAIVPMLSVLIGGGAIAALHPIVNAVAMEGDHPSSRAVATLFLGATVYLALMVMALKTAGALVSDWRVPREASERGGSVVAPIAGAPVIPADVAARVQAASTRAPSGDDRIRAMVAALPARPQTIDALPAPDRSRARAIAPIADVVAIRTTHARADQRIRSVGGAMRARPATLSRRPMS